MTDPLQSAEVFLWSILNNWPTKIDIVVRSFDWQFDYFKYILTNIGMETITWYYLLWRSQWPWLLTQPCQSVNIKLSNNPGLNRSHQILTDNGSVGKRRFQSARLHLSASLPKSIASCTVANRFCRLSSVSVPRLFSLASWNEWKNNALSNVTCYYTI